MKFNILAALTGFKSDDEKNKFMGLGVNDDDIIGKPCIPGYVRNSSRDASLDVFSHDCGDPYNNTYCCGTLYNG